MPKQRRLSDLYVVGKEVTLDDGAGEPITVWVQKLNPVDHETALRYANAARARTMTMRNDPDSVEMTIIESEVGEMDRASLVEYLALDEETKLRGPIEAELAAEEEWSEDGKLQGLSDAWDTGVADTYAENPEDPEALRVFNELKRFADTAEDKVKLALDNVRADYETCTDEKLVEKVADRLITMRADMAWLQEYRRAEVWLSVRESARGSKYFHNRDEVNDLSREVLAELSSAYRALTLDVTEGKGSPVAPTSSSSSEQPAVEETGPSFGQEGAAA